MKILFVGNSYTYYNDMPTLFSRLCGCNGKRAMVFSVTHGGRKLHENLDPNDPVTRQLDAVTAQNTMDVCILQEHSILPITDFERFSANVTGLMDKLGPARFVLYQTWGRKTGSCLSAMTHFRTLFGQLPSDLSCFDLSDETKAIFLDTVQAVCDR